MTNECEKLGDNLIKNSHVKGGDMLMTITRKTELDFKETTLTYRCKKTGKIELRTANLQEWFEDEEYDLIGFETEEMNILRHQLEHLVLGLYDADKQYQEAIDSLMNNYEYVDGDFYRDVKKTLEYQRHIITTHLINIKTKSKSLNYTVFYPQMFE